MTTEMIEKFVENKTRKGTVVNIHFKERSTISGVFVEAGDYNELKSKNFWRIVSDKNANQWEKTQDLNLGRIYHGLSFTRLTEQ